MRNEFFGDARDYLKYQLMDRCASAIPGLQRLVFVPMLQADQGLGHGLTRYRRTGGHDRLADFLDDCAANEVKNVSAVRRFFQSGTYEFELYKPTSVLDPSMRAHYFDEIPQSWLKNAVVFFDPDNGIAPAGARNRKLVPGRYVTLTDLHTMLDRMSPESIALVYQHRPQYQPARAFYSGVAAEVRDQLGLPSVIFAGYGSVGFLVLSRSITSLDDSKEVLASLLSSQQQGILGSSAGHIQVFGQGQMLAVG